MHYNSFLKVRTVELDISIMVPIGGWAHLIQDILRRFSFARGMSTKTVRRAGRFQGQCGNPVLAGSVGGIAPLRPEEMGSEKKLEQRSHIKQWHEVKAHTSLRCSQ